LASKLLNPAGGPISYIFVLCNGGFAVGPTCKVTCTITDPDTTCRDTSFVAPSTGDFITYAPGNLMGLFAYTDDSTANFTNVMWSVTYDHTSFVAP
jgi:hypothetical protein